MHHGSGVHVYILNARRAAGGHMIPDPNEHSAPSIRSSVLTGCGAHTRCSGRPLRACGLRETRRPGRAVMRRGCTVARMGYRARALCDQLSTGAEQPAGS